MFIAASKSSKSAVKDDHELDTDKTCDVASKNSRKRTNPFNEEKVVNKRKRKTSTSVEPVLDKTCATSKSKIKGRLIIILHTILVHLPM